MTATLAETLWLRAQGAQRDMLQIASYSAAFVGTASLQTMHMGLRAPRSFWAAMARASGRSDAAPVSVATASAPVLTVVETPGQRHDDLTALTGVGAKLAAALNAAGITRFSQIAALDADMIDRIETLQKGFRMICARYDLPAQARARL